MAVIHCVQQVHEILHKIQGKGDSEGKQYTKAFPGPVIAQKVGTRMLLRKAAEEQEGRKDWRGRRGKISAQHLPHLSVSY